MEICLNRGHVEGPKRASLPMMVVKMELAQVSRWDPSLRQVPSPPPSAHGSGPPLTAYSCEEDKVSSTHCTLDFLQLTHNSCQPLPKKRWMPTQGAIIGRLLIGLCVPSFLGCSRMIPEPGDWCRFLPNALIASEVTRQPTPESGLLSHRLTRYSSYHPTRPCPCKWIHPHQLDL